MKLRQTFVAALLFQPGAVPSIRFHMRVDGTAPGWNRREVTKRSQKHPLALKVGE